MDQTPDEKQPAVRFQVPLYKLFLVFTAYGAALGSFCRLGTGGIAIGILVGTTGSGVILLARRDNIRSIVVTSFFSFFGGVSACFCCGPELVVALYFAAHVN